MEAIASLAPRKTVEEWEIYLGEQIRNLRIRANLDQVQLAGRADISLGALKNLEGGKGSSLKTLIKVVQTLGRPDWLEALAPHVAISPLQIMQARAAYKPRLKVFRSRRSAKGKAADSDTDGGES
ncbi:XRE family transcriptional regulator [Oxalobacteraceae bacterium CAVE-383]|nr:XRE family transcriptional regulator [Oxalobacteraceae bacterium CAVE-383]